VELTLSGRFFAVNIDPGAERKILLAGELVLDSLGQLSVQNLGQIRLQFN